MNSLKNLSIKCCIDNGLNSNLPRPLEDIITSWMSGVFLEYDYDSDNKCKHCGAYKRYISCEECLATVCGMYACGKTVVNTNYCKSHAMCIFDPMY